MTIFTDRDLERVASLRTNWRTEFLREVARLRHERDIAKGREAATTRSATDGSRTISWPRHRDTATGLSDN